MNDILRIGRDPDNADRRSYMDTHVSTLGIITLPMNIYSQMEESVREYTQRYMQDLAKMFVDLQQISIEMSKVKLDVSHAKELEGHLTGLWYEQSRIMHHIQSTYGLLGTSTVPSMLLPKTRVTPASKCFLVDPGANTAIPANLHMFNQDAYFYHIGGLGFNTYLFVDDCMEGV